MTDTLPPPDEPARLDALRRLRILDTAPERAFDDLTRLAVTLTGAPIAFVSFVDDRRTWLKSRIGIAASEMPKRGSFCGLAIRYPGIFIVPDTLADSRFRASPLVTSEPFLRFYAGVPVLTPDGHVAGMLSVASPEPRDIAPAQIEALAALGRQVSAQLELRLRIEEMSLVNKRLEDLPIPAPSEPPSRCGEIIDLPWDRATEKRLRELTALQRAILDSANYAIISCDPTGLIRTFNASATRMSGYSAEDVVGRANLIALHERMEVMVRAKELSRELGIPVEAGPDVLFVKPRRGQADEMEWTYIRKDGSRFPILLSVTVLRDETGAIIGYLAVGKDLTDHKEVDRMKSEFISTVSHELRTPLTSIRGALGLLDGGVVGTLPPEAQEVVQIAIANSERLVRLINELLELDKMEAGKLELHLQNIDPAKLVTAALEGIRGMADQAGIKLSGSIDVRGVVRGDWDRLIQVLTNLLSNAIKFSPEGGRVHVNVERVSRAGLRFSVVDEGPGVPPDQLHKLFKKFQQLDSSDSRQKGGTGLGLAISKALVEHHGGTIGVDSRPGQGSAFWFEVPFDESPDSRSGRTMRTLPPPRVGD
ncbi:MAG: ATP-binding protein [Polyangiaceae bacterium]|nr:ATP-binding protein [Polyangiaceae bacterium]